MIEIDSTPVEIRARMRQIKGFSGHADEEDILTWMEAIKMTKDAVTSIIHGDIHGTSASLKNTLRRKGFNNKIIVPDINEIFTRDFDK
jgi:predicted metal-dependent RNase